MFKSRALSTTGKPEWVNIRERNKQELKTVRQDISMIFQDPIGSLNPRMTVYDIITEPLVIHKKVEPDTEDYVIDLLKRVGLRPEHIRRYPHEFSGGQRQRIGIARSLALNPQLIICDEPVSALDVSVQAQTLNLMNDLKSEFNLAYIFVAHDLSVVQHISDRIAVMYVGRIAEMANSLELYDNPLHPYTEALMSSVPRPNPRAEKKRIIMEGDVADPGNPPPGCLFHPRCRYAQELCKTDIPELREIQPDHFTACHFAGKLDLGGVAKLS
jgi:oligopeptide/dipeptide ABC transporter ATP-binding protein